MTLHTLAKWNGVTFRTGRLDINLFSVTWTCVILRKRSLTSFIRQHSTGITNKHKTKISRMEKLENGWIKTKHFDVFPWSVSGVESCVVVRNPEVFVAFDMGYTFPDAVRCSSVLISHGHIDHTAGIIQHAAKRSLYSMPPASYFMPKHIIEPLKKIGQLYSTIHDPSGKENIAPMKLHATGHGDTVKITSQWVARPFPTFHRVQSQGYILYKQQKKLKEQYQGLPGPEIGQLVRSGVEVHDHSEFPVLAYTGDTTFDVFLNPPTKDLFEVDTLITEATYIDGGQENIEKAYNRGHSHLLQFAEHEQLFEKINNLIFVHFSDKYSSRYIQRTCSESLPPSLAEKVHLGCQYKMIAESIHHKK